MVGWLKTVLDPRVSRHLISDEGEIVIDEVRRHVVAYVIPGLIMLAGVLIMILTLWAPLAVGWLPILAGLLVVLFGCYRVLLNHMDRFVITNMRVFRVHGVLSQHTATMPMARILDISVHKPFVGRIFRYGHFVFESAAQDQGLRDIRYVARPDERDLTIQRVIQRSGLRSSMRPVDGSVPMGPAPIGPAPIEQGPTGLAPTGQPPMGQPPMGQPPMGQGPMAAAPDPNASGPGDVAPDVDAASAATPDRPYDADELDLQPYDPGPPAQQPPAQEWAARTQHDADLEWLHSGWTDRDQAEHEEALRASGGSDFDRAYRSTEQQQE